MVLTLIALAIAAVGLVGAFYVLLTILLRSAVGGDNSITKDLKWAFRSWGNAGIAVTLAILLAIILGLVSTLFTLIINAYPRWPTGVQATVVIAGLTTIVIPLFRVLVARFAASVNQSILVRVDPVKDEGGEVLLHAYIIPKGVSRNMYDVRARSHEYVKQNVKQDLGILPPEIVDMLTGRGITMMDPSLEYGPFNLGKAERYKDVQNPLVLTISWAFQSPVFKDFFPLEPGTNISTCFIDLREAWLRAEAIKSTKGEGGAPASVQPTAAHQSKWRWPFPFGRLW